MTSVKDLMVFLKASLLLLYSSFSLFQEQILLSLTADKCSRIHIGNKTNKPEQASIKVHNDEMKNSEKENNLGDFVTKEVNSNATLVA